MLPLLAIHSFSWSISGIRITKEIAKSKYFYVPFLVVFWILINAFWIVKRLREYLMQWIYYPLLSAVYQRVAPISWVSRQIVLPYLYRRHGERAYRRHNQSFDKYPAGHLAGISPCRVPARGGGRDYGTEASRCNMVRHRQARSKTPSACRWYPSLVPFMV